MPVVLEPGTWDQWLDPERKDAAALRVLLVPAQDGTLTRHAVSDRVNKPEQDGPDLIEPVEEIDPNGQARLL